MIVQASPTQPTVVEGEAQRLDQVQTGASVRAETNHVAGVRRNFGLVEDDVEHARAA